MDKKTNGFEIKVEDGTYFIKKDGYTRKRGFISFYIEEDEENFMLSNVYIRSVKAIHTNQSETIIFRPKGFRGPSVDQIIG